MKNHFYIFVTVLFMTTLLLKATNSTYAQGNTWKLGGNNNVGTNDFIGSTNNADFKVISNNQLRINVRKNGTTEFLGKIKMNTDTLIVNGMIRTDSMRILGPLYIGDSSLGFHYDVNIPGYGKTDRISSNQLAINFMKRISYSSGLNFYTSDIKLGVGLQAPQHMLHLHYTPSKVGAPTLPVEIAFTNNNTHANLTDGFIVGIISDGTAEINQQEDKAIILKTNSLERMKIFHGNVLGHNNISQITISESSTPVITPKSLLHLGYDGPSTCWRDWMHLGQFIGSYEQYSFLGLKNESSNPSNLTATRMDMIMSWGNSKNQSPSDPSNYRFIYTSMLGMFGISGNANGLEAMRFFPFFNTTTSTIDKVNVGVGDFTGVMTTDPPSEILDVNGNGRIRTMDPNYLTTYNSVLIDATGVLHKGPTINNINNVDAHNGLYLHTTNPTDIYLGGPLVEETDIKMSDHRLYFSGQTPFYSHYSLNDAVGIGYQPPDDLIGKLSVKEGDYSTSSYTNSVNEGTIALSIINYDPAFTTSGSIASIGTLSQAVGRCNPSAGCGCKNIGGQFQATNAVWNEGIVSFAYGATNGTNYGGMFFANQNTTNIAVHGQAEMSGNVTNQSNWGGNFYALNGMSNVGIYAQASSPVPGSFSLAGSFYGDVWINGTQYAPGYAMTSDSIIKENVVSIPNSLQIISKLTPHKFSFNKAMYPYLNMPDGEQYGLIAQEVERVVPDLVSDFKVPNDIDTAGHITEHNLTLKTLNYNGFIPILIQGVKELDSTVTVLQNTTPPPKPVLSYPTDSISNMPVTITFTWHKSERATSYILYVNQNSGNVIPSPIGRQINPLRVIMLNTTDTFATVTLPDYNTTYNWEVIAYNDAGSSDVSDVRIFTTQLPPVPVAPLLVFPLNAAPSMPLANTFQWHKSIYASGYTLYISTTQAYDGVVTIMNVIDTFANASVPNYNTTYYWWVKASNISGTSPESDIWSFTTRMPPVPPAPPLLISPANGDSLGGYTMTVNFYWHKSPKATSYSLYVSTTPDEMGLIYNTTIADTFNMHPVFGYNKNYYWWVIACNQNGCGVKSDVWRFFIKPYGSMAKSAESTLSDSTLKTDITSLDNAVSLISQLQPVHYYWDTINNTWLPSAAQIGLVGQQVQNVVPEVVFKDSSGYVNIQYGRLVALLVEGMKEQQSQIDSLKVLVLGTNQKTNGNSQGNTQYVELENVNAIILNQNDPNPFAEETNITYYIPDDVNNAQLMFYDNNGKIIKTVEITGKGNGTLHVYASNLSSGIYTYALVADGKVIDTKKMMKSK